MEETNSYTKTILYAYLENESKLIIWYINIFFYVVAKNLSNMIRKVLALI